MNLKEIQILSLNESKTLIERCVKLQEESGELAEQILIAAKASGSQRKKASIQGIKEETADVLLVALSIFFKDGGTIAELEKILSKKAKKWKKFQVKRGN